MKGKGKRLLIAFAMTVLIFAGSATAYAWFTYQRRLTTITKINAPTALIIGAGQKESSQNIDIGEINVEEKRTLCSAFIQMNLCQITSCR